MWRERGPKLQAREIIAGHISQWWWTARSTAWFGLVGGVSSLFYEWSGSDLTERK